jgi:Cu/Ag efflux protein CusF
VAGYVIEGHVPAVDILRLLRQKPQALGLAVPGMPIGSPGMDGEVYKGRRDAYEVLLVQRDGSTRTFAKYPGAPVQQRVSAQSGSDSASLPWALAEVRRIDAASRKVSLRHEEIKNLDMPPMTMVFQVREGVSLDGLRVGQRIRFQAVQDKGAYWMVAWQAAAV